VLLEQRPGWELQVMLVGGWEQQPDWELQVVLVEGREQRG
jgi:hypothetical protein